jgi:flagellar motor protein MotB
MTRLIFLLLLFCGGALSGCASAPARGRSAAALENELAATQRKFELARRENYRLKNELTLFRKTHNIDSEKFVEAADVLAGALQKDIADKNVWLGFTERGLLVTVSSERLFVSGSSALSDEGKAFLDQLQEALAARFPTNYIYIEGHTDNQSLAIFEWKSNWDFSFARALNVLKYFTEVKKMDPWRFSAAGFGQYRPRDTKETKEGRRLNRRVEIIIAPEQLRRVSSLKNERARWA